MCHSRALLPVTLLDETIQKVSITEDEDATIGASWLLSVTDSVAVRFSFNLSRQRQEYIGSGLEFWRVRPRILAVRRDSEIGGYEARSALRCR